MSDYGYRSSSSPEGGRFFNNGDIPEDEHSSRSHPYGDQGSYGSYGSAPSSPSGGTSYGSSASGRGSSSESNPYGSSSGTYGRGGAAGPTSGAASGASGGRASANAYGSSPYGSPDQDNPYGSAAEGGYGNSYGSSNPYGSTHSGASAGSASVGGAASVSGASAGSASVPGPEGPSPSEAPAGAARGSASVTGTRRKGVRSEEDIAALRKKKKQKRRRKVYIAMAAVFIIMMGGITVAGAMFFQSVEMPDQLSLEETSFAYYAGGEHEMGSYGQYHRKLIRDTEDVTDELKWATIALEDRTFYEHPGVDMKGVMRAVWNNVSGGDKQGASTLSMQYAGQLADIRDDISYTRKASEAVIAMKMDRQMSKDEILMSYLNIAYFGRGAYGVAAASEVYFGKPYEELDYAEAVYVVMQVQSPNGFYDPEISDPEEAHDRIMNRWSYGVNGLVAINELSGVTQADIDELMEKHEGVYPTPIEFDENPGTYGANTPTGFVSHGYVYAELRDRFGISYDQLYGNDGYDGGYTIELTIDKELQDAAERLAYRGPLNEDGDGFENTEEAAFLYNYAENMTASIVVVEPGTGEVLAYYGGPDGTGIDKAGPNNPHPPSSTFKTITTAVAIDNGASIESWWDARSGRTFDSLEGSEQEEDGIRNSGDSSNPPEMTLQDSLIQSKNTPMFSIADTYGASSVLETAAKLGLTHMKRNDDNYLFDQDGNVTRFGPEKDDDDNFVLDENGNIDRWIPKDTDEDGNPVAIPIDRDGPRAIVDNHVSFGQYDVSVKDMAVIYATIANNGQYNEPHFIKSVTDHNGNPVPEKRELRSSQAISQEVARDLQHVGNQITPIPQGNGLNDGRPFFGKTGTWERDCHSADMTPSCERGQNSHLWYVGAIPQLSVAAWVGDIGDENGLLTNEWGGTEGVFGGTIAGPLWAEYIHQAVEKKGYDPQPWSDPVRVGSAENGELHSYPADKLVPGGAFCSAFPDHGPCREANDDDDDDDDDDNDRDPLCRIFPDRCDDGDDDDDDDDDNRGDFGIDPPGEDEE
ncbi:transglycosylase domain-containing protein [Natronoglycomyces albus]|uniref:Transglycosylase domain-containing protein n=1 Tax=Natronoglycomyces albus TaxID=2811108 RepID=A0A895XK05_9ACTN|nr:transglycosylase domain-containing protein [Natronoglycomyces albus]QSB05357.1 transglycosylase domain-containing protein [Natronoglycomyces albus]